MVFIEYNYISSSTLDLIKANISKEITALQKSLKHSVCNLLITNSFCDSNHKKLLDDLYSSILKCGLCMLGVAIPEIQTKQEFEESIRALLKVYGVNTIENVDAQYLTNLLSSGFLTKNYDPLFKEFGNFLILHEKTYVFSQFLISKSPNNILSIELNSNFVLQNYSCK